MNEAYINQVYQDGDKDIHFPYWRQILQKETTNFQVTSLEKQQENRQFIGQDEIAMKHPQTGATIKLCDDGSIEFFVTSDTGIRLDAKENTIIFYGDAVHFATKEMKMHTKPYGLIWNNHNFNPYFYSGEKQGDETYIPTIALTSTAPSPSPSPVSQLPLFQKQTRKMYYDDKVNSILTDMGMEPPKRR